MNKIKPLLARRKWDRYTGYRGKNEYTPPHP